MGDYHDNAEIDLVLSATDVTSRITYVEWGLKAPSAGSFSWQRMPVCTTADGEGSNAVFCAAFDPAALDGEGVYELKFRGMDAAGNETEIAHTVYVDDTAPTSSSSYDNSWQTATADPTYDNVWTVNLSGSFSDPNITANVAGSGVRESAANGSYTVWVTAYDENGNIAGDGRQPTSISGGAWNLDYRFSSTPPQGGYSFTVEVEDNVGNKATHNLGSYRFDARAASADLRAWNIGREISHTLTISGTASDQTDLGGSLVQLHFEEPTGATTFYDSSYENNHATCTDCPTAGGTALYGDGVLFDGVSDAIVVPQVVDPAATAFTAVSWFKRTTNSSGSFLSQTNGTGTGATWLRINPAGLLRTELGGGALVGQTAVSLNQWHHAAVSYDGTTLRLYLDGKLENEANVAMLVSNGNHVLGTNKNGDQPFAGMLDELVIYDRALLASDIYGLSRQEASGVQSVEVWLEPFLFTGEANTPAWNNATLLDAAGSKLVNWEYGIGSGIEGYYRLNHRATDSNGNTGGTTRGWRGVIDTKDPTVGLFIVPDGFGSAIVFNLTFSYEDAFLDEATITNPCGDTSAELTYTYHPNTNVVTRIEGSCRFVGESWLDEQRTALACDLYGHCAEVTRTFFGNEPSFSGPRVAIASPQSGAILPFTGGAVSITVGANDLFGGNIASLTVSDQSGVIDTISYAPTEFDVQWTTLNWVPPSPGTYMLTAGVTGGDTDVIEVTLVAASSPVLGIANPVANFAELTWTEQMNNCTYNIRRSSAPYSGFTNLAEGTAVSRLFHIDQNNIGVVGTNDYYSVERVSCPGGFGTAVTNTVGEFDFAIVPGG